MNKKIIAQFKALNSTFQKRAGRIEKRFRFVISVAILSFILLLSTFFLFDQAILFIVLLFILSYGLTYFSILEGIDKIEWWTLFFMPVITTVAFYLVFFLFPGRWLTRLPFITIYIISFYAVLLCSNIFNVGVEKSLQLYRAAFSVNFFYQSIVIFLVYSLLLSLKQNFLINGLVAGGLSFLFCLHLLWTIHLKMHIEKEIIFYSFLVALVIAEIAIVLSFVPLKTTIMALFLTSSYYSLSGLIYNYIDQRLFKEIIREYLIVWIFVSALTLLSISW